MKHEDINITKITKEGAVFLMTCPECGRITASGSKRDLMPEWTSCNGEEPKKLSKK
jgi:hypothetical protein